jgi:inorganic pyrophosphatase
MRKIGNWAAGWALVVLLGVSLIDGSAAMGGQAAAATPRVVKNPLVATDPINPDGTINVVISIPAGTIVKTKTAAKAGKSEDKSAIPTHLRYLAYPANYGLIPHTSQPQGQGDEGAPMPAIVLGAPVPAGTLLKTRPLGALVVTEGVKIFNTALLVAEGSPFPILNTIEEFDAQFPGVTTILRAWFTSYRGVGKDGQPVLDSYGFYDREDAIQLIGTAILSYERARVTEADKKPLDKNGNPVLYSSRRAKNEYRE